MRKSKKTLAILAIIAMVLMMIPVQAFADTASATTRLAGDSRVDTAIAIANNGWASGASTVVVVPANDENLVDALAVAPLAKQLNAPVLITDKAGLDAKVAAEIATLKATTVYAVGALSDATVAQLKALSGVTVNQIKGADRFETAAQIAAKLTNPAGTFVVAYNGLADALSAASFAAANGYAIMVADTNGSLPASEKVVGSKTYTVGGQVAAISGATSFAGADRYATNDAVIKGLTFKYDKVYVANGETLVDALAGSVLAALTNSAIVLANTTGAAAAADVSANMTASSQVIAFGGTAVVPDAVKGSIAYTAPAVLAVQSVSAINLKQVKVTFTKAVDKTSAETLGNYQLVTGSNTSTAMSGNDAAKLQADGLTVILTLETANAGIANATQFSNQTKYTLKVSNVRDGSGNVIASTSTDFTPLDIAIPTATSVSVISPSVAKVFYSAPIQTTTSSDYSVDNGQYSVSVGTVNDQDYSVTLTFGSSLSDGAHTLAVYPSGGSAPVGYNGLKVNNTTLNFTTATDTTAPTFAISKIKVIADANAGGALASQVQIKFNKPVALYGKADIYYNYDQVGTALATTSDAKPNSVGGTTSSAVGNKLLIDANATTFTQGGTFYADTYNVFVPVVLPVGNTTIFVDNDADVTTNSTLYVKDAYGNKLKSGSAVGSYTVDTTKPVVTAVAMNGQSKIDVTFSKDLSNGTRLKNYTFKDSTGALVTPGTISGIALDYSGHPLNTPTIPAGKTYWEVDLSTSLTPGTYTLLVSGVNDTATPAANTMDDATFTLTVTDQTSPSVITTSAKSDGSKIYVYFNKVMNATGSSSILDVNNYTWKGSSLPSGTTISATNGNTVAVIALPAGNTAAGGDLFAIGTVKDTNGNVLLGAVGTGAGGKLVADGLVTADVYNTASYNSLKATATDTLTFEVDQPLQGVDASKILVNGQAAASASYVNQQVYTSNASGAVNGALITVKASKTPADKTWSSDLTSLNAAKQVELDANALTNINGGKNAAEIDLGTAASIAAKDYVAPSFSSATAPKTHTSDGVYLDYVTVTFNEAIQASSVTASTFGVAGYNVIDVQPVGAAAGADGSLGTAAFNIILKQNAVSDIARTPSITLLQSVKDNSKQHNVLNTSDSGATPLVTVVANAASLSGYVVAKGVAVGNTAITYAAAAGNTLATKVQAGAFTVPAILSTPVGTAAYASGADLAVTAGQHVGLYELNGSGQVVKFVDYTVQAADIK